MPKGDGSPCADCNNPAVPLSPPAFDLLRYALRARPTTVVALRALVTLDDADFAAALAELTESACVWVEPEGSLGVAPPDRTFATLVLEATDQRRTDVHSLLNQTMADIRDLQMLARDWAVGEQPVGVVQSEFIHGPMAARDAGAMLHSRRGPLPSLAVLPDTRCLERPPPEILEPFLEALRAKPEVDRILLGPYDGADREFAGTLELFRTAGTEFRTHPQLPGWFAVDADHTVLVPAEWGEHWPSSVLILNHPSIAALARQVFEQLWTQAQPLADPRGLLDQSWVPLLRLMAAGATTDAAARSLGISPRTARRRISAAMRHHRAHTLFDLGVAVGRSGPL